jgi:hypothetical protein
MAGAAHVLSRSRAICLPTLALIVAMFLAEPTSAHEGAAQARSSQSVESLFVVAGQEGSSRRVPGRRGHFELVVGRAGRVASFTDRPARHAGSFSLSGFVRAWKRLGFESDPPNAALVVADAPAKRDVVIVELRRPRLARGGGIAFAARVERGSRPRGLAGFVRRADVRVPQRFGRVSLFIDPGGAPTVQVVIQITGLSGGTLNIDFTRSWTISNLDASFTGQIGQWIGSLRAVLIAGAQPAATVNLSMSVTGTGNAVTGMAQVPPGVTVTALSPASKVITNGQFTLPIGG